MRLLGAVLLMGGGLWLGLGRGRALRVRKEALESWAEALGLLENELAFCLPDMPELLGRLAGRTRSPARETLGQVERDLRDLGERSFGEIWDAAVTGCAAALPPEDLDPVRRLGQVLGRCGWEDQRAGAETVRRTLLAQAAQLGEDLRREGRVYGTLGLACGAFVTILLL